MGKHQKEEASWNTNKCPTILLVGLFVLTWKEASLMTKPTLSCSKVNSTHVNVSWMPHAVMTWNFESTSVMILVEQRWGGNRRNEWWNCTVNLPFLPELQHSMLNACLYASELIWLVQNFNIWSFSKLFHCLYLDSYQHKKPAPNIFLQGHSIAVMFKCLCAWFFNSFTTKNSQFWHLVDNVAKKKPGLFQKKGCQREVKKWTLA